ncbi:MAG: BNR-4 repeat-containing protein [Elusimicrobiota bacterium]
MINKIALIFYLMVSQNLLTEGCNNIAKFKSQRNINILQLRTKGYGKSSINLSVFRKSGLMTLNNVQIISYFGSEGDIVLAFRDLTKNRVFYRTLKNEMMARLLGDGHCSINMGYSNDGYLHLICGAHATVPYYLKLKIVSLQEGKIDIISTDFHLLNLPCKNITYPQFYNLGNHLLLVYRNDDANTMAINKYDTSTGTWQKYHISLIKANNIASVYINTIGIRDNYVAIAYTCRVKNDNPNSNENIYVIYSDNFGLTFKDSNSAQLIDLPIDGRREIPPLMIIPQGSNLINQCGAFIDSRYIFRIVYYANDKKGIPQIYMISYDLKHNNLIAVEQVTSRNLDFELAGMGTLSLPISRPEIFQIGDNLAIIYREVENIILLKKPIECQGNWQTYSIFTGYIKNWEPVVDTTLLLLNKLSIFIQGAKQGESDTIFENGIAQPILIIDYW